MLLRTFVIVLVTQNAQSPGTPASESCVASGGYGARVRRNFANLVRMTDNQAATPTLYAGGARFTVPGGPTAKTVQAAVGGAGSAPVPVSTAIRSTFVGAAPPES